MAFRPRSDHPYAHAPLFPDGQVDVRELFEQRSGPMEIEIGPGRGGFVFERCAARADVRILGLEIRLKWASVVDERLRASGLSSRARVLHAGVPGRTRAVRAARAGRGDHRDRVVRSVANTAMHSAGRVLGTLIGPALFPLGFVWNGVAAMAFNLIAAGLVIAVVRETRVEG